MTKPVGRPSKLTQEALDNITAAISIGAPHYMAARYGGISHRTFQLWYAQGRDIEEELQKDENLQLSPKDKEYLQFFHAIEEATASGGIVWLDVINKAAHMDARHAWRLLETHFPDTFKPTIQRMEHTGKDGQPIETKDVSELPNAERIARVMALFDTARARRDNESGDIAGSG